MQQTRPQFGPLTYGTALGACIGLAIFLFGLYAIRDGDAQRTHESLLVIAIGGAFAGCLLGFFAESLIRHPSLVSRPWVRYVVRPISFCTIPYLLVASALQYYGYHRLMGGFGFWFCVAILPAMGLVYAFRRDSNSPVNHNNAQ